MKKHKWIALALGAAVLGTVAYVGIKFYCPPDLTILSLNPLDGTGTFQWGSAGGTLGPGGGYVAGWGWAGSFNAWVPTTGYTFTVTKNGTLYKTYPVNAAGIIKL